MKAHVALIASIVLAGCGGGGGGGSNTATPAASATPASSPTPASTPAVAAAQGIYNTAATSNGALTNVVLSDGSFYLFNVNNLAFTDVVIGNSTSTATTLTSTNAVDFSFSGTANPASLSATYAPQQTFNGTLTVNASNIPFTSDYNNAYNNTVSLTQIAGAYTGANATLSGAVQNQITVKPDLSFTGVSSTCQFAGQLTALHGSVYDATIVFPAGCPFSGTTITGIALFDPTLNQLVVVASPQNRSNVFLAIDTMTATTATSSNSCSIFNPTATCSTLGTASTMPATPATPASGTSSTGSGSESCTNATSCSSGGSTTTSATTGM
jgi:hypothetical protein